MLKGAIFDLDGLLIDTEGFQWQGWVEVLKPLGVVLSKEEYIEKYAGKSGPIIEAELFTIYSLNLPKGSLLAQKEKLLLDWFRNKPIKLMPYARKVVDFFMKKNFKLAVASSGPREEIELKLKKVELNPKFETVVSREEVVNGKPYPDMYLLGAKKLGLRPEDCLAFEDTQYGLESAKSAGLICLVVPTEFSLKQDFSLADGMFQNLNEAINWIKKPGLKT